MIYAFNDRETGQHGDAPWPDIVKAVGDGILSPHVLVFINGQWLSYAQASSPPAAIASPPPLPVAAQPTHVPAPAPQVIYMKERNDGPNLSCLAWLGLGAAIGLFILIGIGIVVNMSQNEQPETPAESAYNIGMSYISKNLKDPSSATFHAANHATSFSSTRKDGRYEVGGTVRAQNSFGAFSEQKWRVIGTLTPGKPDTIKVSWFEIGNQKSGPYPVDE
ncbi:MAG: hypothetical protein QM755_09270 [Luteolibacter sp.]